MRIHVESTKREGVEPVPAKFRLNGVDIDVAEIVEQWPGGHDRFFNVRDADNNSYLLRRAEADVWELLMFLSKRGAGIGPIVRLPGEPRRGPPKSNGRL
jgi:hypothetical protein